MPKEYSSFPADVSVNKGFKLLTREQEIELAAEIKQGSQAAEKKLFESNVKLVHFFARRYCCNGMDYEDLLQEGYIALIKAVQKYDSSRGTRFVSFAGNAIRNNMMTALVSNTSDIVLPKHLYLEYMRLRQKIFEFQKNNADYPSYEELYEFTGLSQDKIKVLLNSVAEPLPLFVRLTKKDGNTFYLEDEIVDPKKTTETEACQNCLPEDLSQIISILPEKNEKVLIGHYGLAGQEPKTYNELAAELGFSKSYICNLEHDGLDFIRQHPRVDDLRSYLGT
jgi:RNA polymerase primary sigma factor